MIRRLGRPASIAVAIALSACSTTPGKRAVTEPAARTTTPSTPAVASLPPKKGGGYYLDDGPGDNPPPNLDLLPDAVPRIEKYASGANRPYNVFGVDYVPDLSGAPYKQRGVGSWYGRKFHGQRTSSGEIYDMYAMTAAHPTLPIPCYALVTNVQNGKSVIVRVNDRGPFLHNRIMDLSYAAALKVGYLSSGSGLIEVELLSPADIAAGRIPITTNSVYLASVAGGGPRTAPLLATAPAVAPTVGSTTVAIASLSATPAEAMPSSGSTSVGTAPGSAGIASTRATTSSPGSSQTASTTAAPSAPMSSTAFVAGTPNIAANADRSPLPASYAARGIPSDLIPDPQPPARLPEVATGAGYYLQLGAFRVRAGADSFAAHVTREIDPAIASKIHVSDANGLFRVRIGPYALRADADSAALDLRAAIAQPVVVMPEGATR